MAEEARGGCFGCGEKSTSQFSALSINFVSVVCIILINKALFTQVVFPVTLLATLHFGVGTLFLWALKKAGRFTIPEGSKMDSSLWLLVVVQSSAVVCNNFSLRFNSIGFYQLFKQFQMPLVAIIDFVAHGKTIPTVRIFALSGVFLGVVAATVSDVSFNVLGFLLALLGVLCSAMEATTWSRVQQAGGWSAMGCMYMVMPWCAVASLGEALVLELDLMKNLELSMPALYLTLASCFCAFLVNWSMVWFNGAASALTYALLGYGKTLSILIGGAMLFDSTPTIRSLLGATFALTMIAVYSVLKLREVPPPPSQAQEGVRSPGSAKSPGKDEEEGAASPLLGGGGGESPGGK